MSALEVLASGPLTTLQDEGRRGHAAVGVGRSGAADLPAYRAAIRLAGNSFGAAALETTAGGLEVRARGRLAVAVTGPPTQVLVNGRPAGSHALLRLRDGDVLSVLPPPTGLRNYLAVRGGITGAAVLGSLSTDLLSGLGPAPVEPGDLLKIGGTRGDWPMVDQLPPSAMASTLDFTPGPRADWFTPTALETLNAQRWTVTADANRVGVRLRGARGLDRAITRELPSEGMALGAVQVPADGQPVLFLADHPVTGGYPVIAVLTARAVAAAAQLRPGDSIRLAGAP